MAQYFDLSTDIAMVRDGYHATLRRQPEIAHRVEQEILDRYTRFLPNPQDPARAIGVSAGSDLFVFLRGYAVDPAQANPMLRRTLRQAVVEVLTWRLAQAQQNPLHREEQAGAVEVTIRYRDDAREPFPPGWDRTLSAFDSTGQIPAESGAGGGTDNIWGW